MGSGVVEHHGQGPVEGLQLQRVSDIRRLQPPQNLELVTQRQQPFRGGRRANGRLDDDPTTTPQIVRTVERMTPVPVEAPTRLIARPQETRSERRGSCRSLHSTYRTTALLRSMVTDPSSIRFGDRFVPSPTPHRAVPRRHAAGA